MPQSKKQKRKPEKLTLDAVWDVEQTFLAIKAADNLHEFYLFDDHADDKPYILAAVKLDNFLSEIDQFLQLNSLPLPWKCQCMYSNGHRNMFQLYIDSNGKKFCVIVDSANDHSNLPTLAETLTKYNYAIKYGVSTYKSSNNKRISFQRSSFECKQFALFFMWKARKVNLWQYIEEHSRADDCKNELGQQIEYLRDNRTQRVKHLSEDEKLHILGMIDTYDIKCLPDNFFKIAQSMTILNSKNDGAILSRLKGKGVIRSNADGKQYNDYLDANFQNKLTIAYNEFHQTFDSYWPWKDDSTQDAAEKDRVKQLKLWSEQEPAKYLQAWHAKLKG